MKTDLCFGLEQASWPALLVDSQAVVRHWSQGAKNFFGPVLEADQVDLAALWAPANPLTAEQFVFQQQRHCVPTAKLYMRAKGGVSRPLLCQIAPLSYNEQKYLILQIIPEIPATEQPRPQQTAETETSLLSAETAAQRYKLECALQLARTVAADFNNALTIILGHVSHLLNQADAFHPWRNALMEAEKAALKAAEIANDLAAFSRQEKSAPDRSAGNINDVLRRTVELFKKAETTPREMDWVLNLEPRLYAVNFDEAKIQQAFSKIIENSIQAIAEQELGFRGMITIQTRNVDVSERTRDRTASIAPGSYVCIEIKDDGIGISPENLEHVWEPFFTTKKGRRGLGLAYVYGVVTNHSGYAVISSERGQGTAVRIYLPASKRYIKDAPIPTDGKKSEWRGHETILMVDDEDLLLTMAQMVLADYGYHVLTANNAEKAMEIIQTSTRPIDLLIADIVMPKISGRQLSEFVRKIRPKTKILLSSGYFRPAAGEQENYLPKPFTSQDLLRKVKEVLSAKD